MGVFLAVFLYALFFTFVFSFIVEGVRSTRGFGFSFILLLLPLWALALFIPPMGPVYAGIAWVDIFFIALFLALFIGASTPPRYYHVKRKKRESNENANNEITMEEDRGLTAFFWVLMAGLVAVILARNL